MRPSVVVFPRREVRGWDGQGEPGELFPVVELREALERRYPTDAHFACYVVVDADGHPVEAQPRLNKASAPAVEAQDHQILFSALVVDVDDPVAHANGTPARDDWRAEQEDALEAMPEALGSTVGQYDTRGGYRLVWQLSAPVGVDEYLHRLRSVYHHLRAAGVEPDELLDWNRLYRLPRVRRDGVDQDAPLYLRERHVLLRWDASLDVQRRPGVEALVGIERAHLPGQQVPEQIAAERNNTLMRVAGRMRRGGLGEPEILEAIRAVNTARCQPPLDDDEVQAIARSVCRYEPDAEQEAQPDRHLLLGDEVELRDAVARDLEPPGTEPHVYDRAQLWRYDTARGYWTQRERADVINATTRYSGVPVANGRDRGGEPRFRPLKLSANTCGGVVRLFEAARTRTGFFDARQTGLTLRNGFLRVDEDGAQLVPWSPDQRALDQLDVDYTPGAVPQRFLACLRDVWCTESEAEVAGRVELLREWIGAALVGLAPRFAKAVVFVGVGANGKSTVSDVIQSLFPRETVSAIPPQDMDQEYRRAMLAASRLNVVAELPETDILAGEAVKAMISGDTMTARQIMQPVFTFRPRCGHLFSANTLPAVRDNSRGFWRRWLVVPFEREFLERDQIAGLSEQIVASERSEILSWAVDGAVELLRRGQFAPPPGCVAALEAWRHTADVVSAFLADETETETDEARFAKAADLYAEYVKWAEAHGHRKMSSTKFGVRLAHLGVAKTRSSSGMRYGVRFRQQDGLSKAVH